MEFDAKNIKTLIGLDDPIETMAKSKAPVEWRGQALLIVSSNVLPTFPADDGGLSTRISLLRFPFSFVPRPEGDQTDRPTEPGLRWQDPSVKLSLMGTLVPEFFFWGRLLNQQLATQLQTGRMLMPRPAKVDAETAELFKSGALVSPAGEDESTLLSMLREFDMLHMVEVPADTNSQRGGDTRDLRAGGACILRLCEGKGCRGNEGRHDGICPPRPCHDGGGSQEDFQGQRHVDPELLPPR